MSSAVHQKIHRMSYHRIIRLIIVAVTKSVLKSSGCGRVNLKIIHILVQITFTPADEGIIIKSYVGEEIHPHKMTQPPLILSTPPLISASKTFIPSYHPEYHTDTRPDFPGSRAAAWVPISWRWWRMRVICIGNGGR